MEHDDLDKIFRDLIQKDDSEMNEQEFQSKEMIWNEVIPTAKSKKVFPFWQIAAAVLLLLLAGTSCFFINQLNHQNLEFAELEENYFEMKNNLQNVEKQFAELDSENKNPIQNIVNTEVEKIESVKTIVQKELVENVIYVRDTVFLEKNISPKEKVQLVRDTVFIEVPAKKPMRLVDIDSSENLPKEKFSKKKKKSSKIEFVFGKKSLEKPIKSPLIIINDSDVAKKSQKTPKKHKFTIPINN